MSDTISRKSIVYAVGGSDANKDGPIKVTWLGVANEKRRIEDTRGFVVHKHSEIP